MASYVGTHEKPEIQCPNPSAPMPEIGIRELRDRLSQVLEEVDAGERFVVSRHRRPIALLLSMSEARDFALAHAEEFVEMRLRARSDHEIGNWTIVDDVHGR